MRHYNNKTRDFRLCTPQAPDLAAGHAPKCKTPQYRLHFLTKPAIVLAGLLAAGVAQAVEPQSFGVYVEGGRVMDGSVHTSMTAVGVRSPVTHTFWDGRVSLRWDLYLSEWRTAAAPGGRQHFTQAGLVPMFRYRFDRGASPWFVEGGVGLSYLSASYSNRVKEFSTQWNFSDHLGVGRNFGIDRQHELGLYVKHVSNAGIKSPNPGETFVQLRYGYNF